MPPSEGQTIRNESVTEYFDNGWIKKSSDAWDISTTYEYDDLGAQTARTLTSADGSANRTMSWSYFPDGKLQTKSDDGVPVGSHSVVTDNDTAGLAEATGTWATASAAGEQGTNHRTHAAVSGASTDEFTWTLDAPADGTYAVAVTYPQVPGAATDASFELTHGEDGDGHGGEVTEPAYVVDQSAGAGGWSDMGRVELRKGDPVTVTLKPSADGTVVADGVRLVRDNAADTDTEARAFAYAYDVNGNLTGINDTSSGARADDYQVTYTGLNQVESVTESLTGQETTTTTNYAYDVLGQPVTVAHPDQASQYEYADPRHLLTQVSVDDLNDTAAAKVTGYTYDNRGMRATETKANGNVVTNGYFLDGALKSLREEKSGGALVSSHAYTYDDNGNKHTDAASKANADVAGAYLESTTTYSYDPVDRLSESVKTGNGAKTETYVHDDNANVISQDVGGTATTYSYDRNRLLTAATGGATASYRYDPFGRQTSVVSAGLTISRTTYDGFDHIAESEKMNDAGELESTTYAYDPLDRTASKTAGGETTDYTYLGLSSEVLGEEVAGQLTKSYQYSPWGQRLSQITHQADPEAGVEAGESAYYGYNAHTDVETLTDDTGNTVATYGYTAYGDADESEYTGIDKPDVSAPEDSGPYNAYRYNSKRWDAGSGTYDMGFRDYAPGLNRFTTRDMYNGALANMGLGSDPYTGNRYAFTAGNPISRIEMDGHDWGDEFSLGEFGDMVVEGAVEAVTGTIGLVSDLVTSGYSCATGDSCENWDYYSQTTDQCYNLGATVCATQFEKDIGAAYKDSFDEIYNNAIEGNQEELAAGVVLSVGESLTTKGVTKAVPDGANPELALGFEHGGLRDFARQNGFNHYLDHSYPDWIGPVRNTIEDGGNRLHVLTAGFEGLGGVEGMMRSGARLGTPEHWTSREMAWIGNAVSSGTRSWDSVNFYDGNHQLIDIVEPDWSGFEFPW
jgi:RHS repeat-associated protein